MMGRWVPQDHSKAACCLAACNDHLHILQWARERERERTDASGCLYYDGDHYNVSGRHILQWARENSCPGWPEDTNEN